MMNKYVNLLVSIVFAFNFSTSFTMEKREGSLLENIPKVLNASSFPIQLIEGQMKYFLFQTLSKPTQGQLKKQEAQEKKIQNEEIKELRDDFNKKKTFLDI